ncbi:hypothetical protein F5887DRAFT_28970 [Amanita rubescens]|nr:hypothetical protein F5887DRAFT_28970 [Amanita rubescens]
MIYDSANSSRSPVIYHGAATAIARTRILASCVVRAGMMGTRRMGVLARLAVHDSLTHDSSFFFSSFLQFLLLIPFTILVGSSQGRFDLFSSCFLAVGPGLRPFGRPKHVKNRGGCQHHKFIWPRTQTELARQQSSEMIDYLGSELTGVAEARRESERRRKKRRGNKAQR